IAHLVFGHALLELLYVDAVFDRQIQEYGSRIVLRRPLLLLGKQGFLVGPVLALLAGTARGDGGGKGVVMHWQWKVEEDEAHLAGCDQLVANTRRSRGKGCAGWALVIGKLADGDGCINSTNGHAVAVVVLLELLHGAGAQLVVAAGRHLGFSL